MDVDAAFSDALKLAMLGKEMPTQKELAALVGVKGSHISQIINGKLAGSERVRRKIADILGLDYDGLIRGEIVKRERGPAVVAARAAVAPETAIPLMAADLDGLFERWPDAMNHLAMVPLIRLAAVMYGRPPGEGDIMGWVAAPVRDPSPSVVAVRLGRSDIARLTGDVAEWLMVVDTAQREVVDGSWYLLRPPARIPVQRCFRQPGMIIMMRGDGDSASGPQVIDLAAFPDVVVGRVVAGMVQM